MTILLLCLLISLAGLLGVGLALGLLEMVARRRPQITPGDRGTS